MWTTVRDATMTNHERVCQFSGCDFISFSQLQHPWLILEATYELPTTHALNYLAPESLRGHPVQLLRARHYCIQGKMGRRWQRVIVGPDAERPIEHTEPVSLPGHLRYHHFASLFGFNVCISAIVLYRIK